MTLVPGYFNRPEVSNSDLKALARMLAAIPDNRDDLEDIFNFGSLVDALLTEAYRVNHEERSLSLETGGKVYFEKPVFDLAKKLAANLKKDRVVSLLIDNMVGQYIVARTLKFTYDDEEYEIKGRCKFDGLAKKFRTGCDYKTTSCTTRKAFVESIEFFDYDQAGAWYMDLARIDRFWIIGISKKTGEVFKYAIERGDETYRRGRDKYARLAYKWIMLIANFNLTTI